MNDARHLATRLGVSVSIAVLMMSGCKSGRDVPPPPDVSTDPGIDTSVDTVTDTAGDPDTDGPDGSDADADADVDAEPDAPGPEDMRIRLLSWQRIGSNIQVFVSVTYTDGTAVVDLAQEDFFVEEDGSTLSVESSLDIQKRPSNFVWKTLLIFDTSYSVMSSYDLADVVEPARSFAHRIVDRDTRAQRVAVAAFDGAEKLRRVVSVPGTDGDEIYFTANANKLDCDLDAFLEPECTLHEDCLTTERPQCVGGLCIDPSTNLYGSVIAGMSRLEREIDEELRLGIPLGGSLVVFTDGSDQAGRASFSDVTEALDESHVSVFAVGVAGEVETEVLEAIGRDGTVYIGGLDELDAAMDEIWGLVDQIGDGIYLVSYCTPARSGSHDITVGLEASGDSLTFEFAASDEALCDPGLAATACESMTCGEGENLIYCGDCAGDEVCQDGACVLACDEGVCGYYRESELGEEIDCGCCASPLSCVDHLCE